MHGEGEADVTVSLMCETKARRNGYLKRCYGSELGFC